MPHSNIDPQTPERAQTPHRERTKAEEAMWDILRDFSPRGARFRRETPIGPYVVGFAWLTCRLVVEVDGDSHETESGRSQDARRDAFLRGEGYRVLRFDNDLVLQAPDHVFLDIESAIQPFLEVPQ